MALFRLAHLSDPHLPPPAGALDARDLASKRLLSAVAWRRKSKAHRFEILKALVADVEAYGPDHTLITGDLTNFSTRREYAAARLWLQSLGEASEVTVSPGNHDALSGPPGEHFASWGPWLGDEGQLSFPQVRTRGGVALINLCSARPSAPWLATGRLGAEQVARLAGILEDLRERDLFRIMALHHPPVAGIVPTRKALDDSDALQTVVRRHGVDLVLHGHAHQAEVSTLAGPDGAIPVLGVPSASGDVRNGHMPARWHALEIESQAGRRRVRVSARGLSRDGAFESLGAYELALPQRA